MSGLPFSFVNNLSQKSKNLNILISNTTLPFVVTHFRLSSVFYSLQLVDIFAYEVLANKFSESNLAISKPHSTVLVYNFHSLYNQDRFFLFVSNAGSHTSTSSRFSGSVNIASIAEMFSAANWLEREVAELHGVNFNGKKDLRNLMLQYGDSSSPFQKSFPTIGLKEMYCEPLKDTIIQNPISVQL